MWYTEEKNYEVNNMERYFNITGCCDPKEHYMVNLNGRLARIRKMVDKGQYFCINRGRQYGKTTILMALKTYLKDEYNVVSMDFQGFSSANFQSEYAFVRAFCQQLLMWSQKSLDDAVKENLKALQHSKEANITDLFYCLCGWCDTTKKPIVLLIDEVDQASNNQIFLDFLAQLRRYYLARSEISTFQSVILAGVHDIRNLQQRMRPNAEHRHNSPWNIASSFDIDMSFSASEIADMLTDYENDRHTDMDIPKISQLIYDYTAGYPVLVSNICKFMDENHTGWLAEDCVLAVKQLLIERNPLFDSLINKLEDNQELRKLLYDILFKGQKIIYNPDDANIQDAVMYGFIKNEQGSVMVSNRIFEIRLYDWYISLEATDHSIFLENPIGKNQFVINDCLNMELILEKFVLYFNDIYGAKPDKFKEEDGRKLFLLYLRPIINGVGNYYIEAQTRNQRRTDVIVDYLGKQYVIELKIWHGNEYHMQGEQQLAEYLDYYHINKGYLLSFNFNKNKKSGMRTIMLNEKMIIEATV